MDRPRSESGSEAEPRRVGGMSSLNVGPAIQRERKAKGLTLEQLGVLSGVSKSMLSQIERSEVNPTLAVVWSLTQALGIDIGTLVSTAAGRDGDNAIEVLPAGRTPEIRSQDGLCRLRILSPPSMAGRTELYLLELAGGGELVSKAHSRGTIEHLTALSGDLDVRSGTSRIRLAEGETARYPADVPHAVMNTGRGRRRGIMMVVYSSQT